MQAFVTRRGCCLQGHTDAPRVIPLEVHKEEEEVEETERGKERERGGEREKEDREGQREKKSMYVCRYVCIWYRDISSGGGLREKQELLDLDLRILKAHPRV